jgi:hypothetical protein
MRWARLTLAAGVVCALVVGTAATAGTSPPTTSPCTYGDVQQTFEAPFTGNLIDSECQYRLYEDGETFTFCEDDYILGGVVWFWEYKLDGIIPRQEAIAIMELGEDHLWIDGVEMPLMHTAWKNGVRPSTGDMTVYQHEAFISRLPVGEHTSYWESFYPGEPLFTSTVHLVVIPSTDPACS